MSGIFQTILVQPIFNAFVAIYNVIPDLGVTIALVTLVIKLVLYPLTNSSIKAQKQVTELQPKLEALKAQYKDNKQMLAQETMKLYKENKVNPVGSCLPVLLQLPVFIALYWVLQAAITNTRFDLLYPFVTNPGMMKTISFGFLDLAKASIPLAVLAGAAQYWQVKMMQSKRPPVAAGTGGKDEDMMAMMNKQMLYMMPIMTVFIGIKLQGGLTLYWLLSTVLTALQQLLVIKKHDATVPPSSNPPTGAPPVIDGKIVS